MPEIFTGKVAIPGDQLGQYLEALAEAEDARAPSRQRLEALNAAFGAHLAAKYGRDARGRPHVAYNAVRLRALRQQRGHPRAVR